jgi:hypothetical protein
LWIFEGDINSNSTLDHIGIYPDNNDIMYETIPVICYNIYGTVFNNAITVLQSLKSLTNIPYKKMYITDNFSTDSTYEILTKYQNEYRLEIIRIKCNQGMGRQISMELAMQECSETDYLMTMDFNTIYGENFVIYINDIIKEPRENAVFNNFLSLKNANSISWRNLNNGEDWERMAHFVDHHFNVYLKSDLTIHNQEVYGSRDRRYAIGIHYYYRTFINTVELQRSWCFKSFGEFYKHVKKYEAVVFTAYLLSKFYKNYCYDPVLNNKEFVKKFAIML